MTLADGRGVLHVVATPIGNLDDLSARAIRVLGEVAAIACEDTRHTAILCARFEISTPRISLHAHNEAQRVPELVARLAAGESLALVSDAGTPLVSDPGARLVRAVLDAGFEVVPVPGPSAALAALVASGFAAQPFAFFGFLPRKGSGRAQVLAQLLAFPGAVVLFEAPARAAKTLSDLHACLGPRRAALARELTKRHETVTRGTLGALALDDSRGELTIVIEGPEGDPAELDAPRESEAEVLARADAEGLSVRDSAARLAQALGIPKRDAYARVLARRAGG